MARPIYKQFSALRTVFCGAFILSLLVFPAFLHAAETSTAFTVEGVEVDVTAKNAVLAREQALEQAQEKAYQMLAERLLSPEEVASLKVPDPITLSSLIQDFEVTKEQVSKLRYKGVYTVRFRPNAMKSRMAADGKTLPDLNKKPVLVLPVFQSAAGIQLWDEANLWMAAWRAMPTDKSLIQPTVLPLGDAQDMAQVQDNAGLDIDPMAVQQMATRYGADDVALLMASLEQGQSASAALQVSIYNNGFEGPVFVQKMKIEKEAQETDDAFYARAAGKVKALLRTDWKANAAYTQAPASQTQEAPVTAYNVNKQPAYAVQGNNGVPVAATRPALGPVSQYAGLVRFSSVQDWVRIKSTLDKIYGMQGVMVKGLKPREAMIDLRFAGDVQAFTLALQNAGISARGGAGGAPFEIQMATPTTYR